jgi:DNA-binding Xre family transcriptional regulator
MDYDRIEKLSKKLGGARLQSRISAAENILTKLKNGIELRESTATILDGICSSLEGMVKSPSDLTDLGNATGELLDALFQIIQRIPTRDYVEPATKILELLYQLETVDGLTEKLKKGLKEVSIVSRNLIVGC